MASEKIASTVVTADNRAEFMAKKLNLEPVVPLADVATSAVEAATEPTDTVNAELAEDNAATDSAAESKEKVDQKKEPNKEAKPEEKEKKHNSGLEKRFAELTKQREDARKLAEEAGRKADAAERRALEAEARLQPKAEQQISAKPEAPKFEAFKDGSEYHKAMLDYTEKYAEWQTQKTLRDREVAENKSRGDREAARLAQSWSGKLNEAKAEFDDYETAITSSQVLLSNEMRDEVFRSDIGPWLLYHIAKHPEIGDKLGSMDSRQATKYLGRLEGELERQLAESRKAKDEPTTKVVDEPEEPVAEEKPIERVVSKAAAPITPIRGTNASTDNLIDSKGNFKGNIQQWKELRRSGKIK